MKKAYNTLITVTLKNVSLGASNGAWVALEGKRVGDIRKEAGGYRYFPTGSKKGGELFSIYMDCVNSL